MGNLNKDIFKAGIVKLIDFYPTWNIDTSSQRVIKSWYEKFQLMEKYAFEAMVESHIENERFNPSVKSLRDNDVVNNYDSNYI